jgi:TATA-box binding protein (TBP) (component of TFIID and TFIIIB)
MSTIQFLGMIQRLKENIQMTLPFESGKTMEEKEKTRQKMRK